MSHHTYVNIWLGVSDAAQDVIVEGLRWDEETQGPYSGPLTRPQRRVFEYMQDEASRRRLFTKPTLAGTVYNLWSIDFYDEMETLQAIRDEIDGLIAQYPNQISILGAWHWEGDQVGTRGGGDPLYPLPAFLWRFLPDPLPDGTIPASNADLQDVNLLFGQSPRDFS